jgi:hypothetical protein
MIKDTLSKRKKLNKKKTKKKNMFQKESISLCLICTQLVPIEIVVTIFIAKGDGQYRTMFEYVLLLHGKCIG